MTVHNPKKCMESAISTMYNSELYKLRLVFEQTPGAIFILDKDFRFEYVNPSFEQLSGYTKEELLGRTVKDLFYHEEIQESRREVVEAMYKGEKWQGELLTHNKNGNTYWANTIAAPFCDEHGAVVGYIMIQQDITEKKRVENALRESEEKYKTLVENSQDGILIVRYNKVLFANDTLCKLLGYCPVGLSAEDIIHPEDIYKVTQIGIRRRNQDFSTINENFRLMAKNGEIKECDTTSTLVKFEGEWASFFTIHDLTENKKIQLELKESEEKYRLLFSAESDAIFMIDANSGQILDVNPATTVMYGYSREELLQMKNTDISAEPEKTSQATKNLETHVKSRLHKRKDGTIFPVELSAGFTKFKNKNIQIVTSRDISERIKSEEALAKSEQRYRDLADFLPQTVFELDIDGNLLYVNKSGMLIMGVNDSDYGKSVLKFFVPEDHERMTQNLKADAREKRPNAFNEYTALKRDGTTFPVIIYGLTVKKDGIPSGTRGIIVDISERKAMENALRESEEKYKTLIENSQDGIFAIMEDKILFANSTFCKMIGYEPEELYAKPAQSLVFPEDRKKGLAISERRKSGDYSTVNDIFRLQAKNGEIIEADVFSAVVDLNNKKVSLITVHDLTEIKRIQTELKKSEKKYRELAEMLPQAVYELDLNANLKYLNKAGREKFGTGYETTDVSVFDIVVPEQLDRMKENFSNVSFKNIPSKGNYYKLRQIDGQIFEAMISATPIIVDGVNIGSRGIVVDLTDRIKIEQELQIAKTDLEKLNSQLEKRVKESSKRLTEARTQLINLQKENLQTQYDVLKQQVNPHFLFNSLNVLTSLIKLEPDLAEKFSEQLSKVYRYVLENKDNELVDLNTELNFLDAYIFLLNIRFVGKVFVNINVPSEYRNDRIIPLAMQLLIENAIKHNVMSKSNPLIIDIFVDEQNCLNIVNNLQERPSQIVSTGVGLKNILNRYKLLNLEIPTFEKTATQFKASIHLVKNTNPVY